MLICHLSDWHASLRSLPEADIYVVTGDMLPNFPEVLIRLPGSADPLPTVWDERQRWPDGALYMGRRILPEREEKEQKAWCEMNPFREATGIPDSKPVVCVRGNHDFIDLAPWIGGNVWEVNWDTTRTTDVLGLKFGGTRGCNQITGDWCDEASEAEMDVLCRRIPEDIDVLVTHIPPYGIMDVGRMWDNIGSHEVNAYVHRRCYAVGEPKFKAHLFGHMHANAGVKNFGGTIFSNAAETYQLVEL